MYEKLSRFHIQNCIQNLVGLEKVLEGELTEFCCITEVDVEALEMTDFPKYMSTASRI